MQTSDGSAQSQGKKAPMPDQQKAKIFQGAMIFASKLLGLSELQLKGKQYEVKGLINKDVLAFLPTGYGKTEFVSGGCTFKKESLQKTTKIAWTST